MQVGLCFSVAFSGRLKHSHFGHRKRDYCERRFDVSKSIFCLETAVRKVVDPHISRYCFENRQATSAGNFIYTPLIGYRKHSETPRQLCPMFDHSIINEVAGKR